MAVAVARLLAYVLNDRDRWRRFLVFIVLVLAVAAVWWVLVDGGVHVLLRDFGRTGSTSPGYRLSRVVHDDGPPQLLGVIGGKDPPVVPALGPPGPDDPGDDVRPAPVPAEVAQRRQDLVVGHDVNSMPRMPSRSTSRTKPQVTTMG